MRRIENIKSIFGHVSVNEATRAVGRNLPAITQRYRICGNPQLHSGSNRDSKNDLRYKILYIILCILLNSRYQMDILIHQCLSKVSQEQESLQIHNVFS